MNALDYVDIDQGIHWGINKVARNEKHYVSVHIPKIWQILKHFAGTFHQA